MNKKLKKSIAFLAAIVTVLSSSLNSFAWSSSDWRGVDLCGLGSGHASMITKVYGEQAFDNRGSGTTANFNNTRYAAQIVDSEGTKMSAANNKYNGITNYSPYHAKAEYSMNDIIAHAGFLYDLAKKCQSGTYLNTTLSSYNSSKTYTAGSYTGTISPTTQKRIVSDLQYLMNNYFTISYAYDQGYVILGVFLHLLQDIYAHRAKFTKSMVDTIPNFENFTNYTKESLKAAIPSSGIPMIKLKNFLDSSGSYTFDTDTGEHFTGLTYNQVYEDNPLYWSDRYFAAFCAISNIQFDIDNECTFIFDNYGILYDNKYTG